MVKEFLKRYRMSLLLLLVVMVLLAVNFQMGIRVVKNIGSNILKMLMVLPPVFILMGLMDVWVPREVMVKYLGEGSAMKGVVLAFMAGSCASGPLYAAFPVAEVFMRKGASFSNILIFLGAWSTTKIPMLLFERSNLGWDFALLRLLINIPGIYLMARLITALVSTQEKEAIYKNAESL